jgi:hypothetical protein
MPVGAWASGMGGAVSADPDYMLSWYNPSRLPNLRDSRAALGMGMRSLGRTEAWASYDFRVPPRVGMGMSLVYRGDPFVNNLFDGYYDGNEVVEEFALNSAAWSALSLKIGAGYLVSRQLSLGGSVAVNYQSLPTTPELDGSIKHSTVTSIGAMDIAASYRMTPNLLLSVSVKNLMSRNSWQMYSQNAFSPVVDEVVPPIFVLGSSHKLTFLERDFVWNADAAIFLFDGEGKYIERPEIVLAAGARWEFSDMITLRTGIADIELSAETFSNNYGHQGNFSPRLTIGFSYALPKFGKGAVINYALLTDRIWAGVDQQLDFAISF